VTGKVRKPLSQLVGPQCESGLPYPHSKRLARVIGSCEHGHGTIGVFEDDGSIWVKDYSPMDTCDTCWREIAGWIQADDAGLTECQDCGHSCRLEITAEWPTGNTTTLRYTPRNQERKQ
jgi:hypothetical protein